MRVLTMLLLASTLGCGNEDGILVHNEPPQASILEPVDGQVFDAGELVRFTGLVGDDSPLEDLLVEWTSSIDGVLPDYDAPDPQGRVEFSTATLSEGTHVITLRAFDAEAEQGEDDLVVVIEEIPELPSIQVIHPTTDELGLVDSPFVFMAVVDDRQDGPEDLVVEMSSNPGGFVCYLGLDGAGNAQCAETLALGSYILTFTVEDSDGNVAQALATYNVVTIDDFDFDGDGYSPNGGDCNDSNATIYPGAPELCDGLDNDCNEFTAIDIGTECYDDDGDGYCEDPPCVNTDETLIDCDDTTPERSPVAIEVVNGLDDDCDSLIDDNTVVYDDDGDGYCETPPCVNTTNTESDCNDADGTIYPSATEVCSDGIDNNCNGLTNEKDAIGCYDYYYDGDEDTYGVPGAKQCWCDSGAYPYTGLNVTDCMDTNYNVHPAQTSFFTAHRGDGSYDYDCTSSEEKQYPGISGGCTSGLISGFTCSVGGAGWKNYVPACGSSDSFMEDCDTSLNVMCLFCAFASDPWTCLAGCDPGYCEPEYDARAQGCR